MSGAQNDAADNAATPEQNTAAFMAGFEDDDASQPTATPAAATTPETPAPSPTPSVPPAPEYVQVTRQDWDALQQKLTKVDSLDQSFDRVRDQVLGTMGRTLDRRLAELQQATPQGAALEFSPEDFAELKEHYPEMAELTLKGLNKVAGKFKGTGGAQADAAAIDKALSARLTQERVEMGRETLDTVYPDWDKDVSTPDFAQWLRTQPGGEFLPLDRASRDQALADASSQLSQYVKANPNSEIARACSTRVRDAAAMLRSFYKARDSKAAPTPPAAPAAPAQPSMRQRQMAAAVATRGEAAAPPPSKGSKSAFQEGFESDD